MSQNSHPMALYQLRKITRITALVILVLVFLGFFLPSDYQVERSVKINASQSFIYESMLKGNSLPQWMFIQGGQVDPFSGDLSVGQTINLSYTESEEVGQLILVGLSNHVVRFDVRPKSNVNPVRNEMSLSPSGNGTLISWTIQGELDAGFFGPYLAYFANDIAGANFEVSLQRLKAQMEAFSQ